MTREGRDDMTNVRRYDTMLKMIEKLVLDAFDAGYIAGANAHGADLGFPHGGSAHDTLVAKGRL